MATPDGRRTVEVVHAVKGHEVFGVRERAIIGAYGGAGWAPIGKTRRTVADVAELLGDDFAELVYSRSECPPSGLDPLDAECRFCSERAEQSWGGGWLWSGTHRVPRIPIAHKLWIRQVWSSPRSSSVRISPSGSSWPSSRRNRSSG